MSSSIYLEISLKKSLNEGQGLLEKGFFFENIFLVYLNVFVILLIWEDAKSFALRTREGSKSRSSG